LARIAAATEAHRPRTNLGALRALSRERKPSTVAEAIASVVETALEDVPCAAVFVPTRTGTTARMISRFKPAVWIVAVTDRPGVCAGLAFSYGVHPFAADTEPDSWRDFATLWLAEHGVPGAIAMLAAGPSHRHPEANHRIEFIRVGGV